MSRFHSHGMIGTWLIGAEEQQAVAEVVSSRSLFRHYGPNLLHRTRAFEAAFAKQTDVGYTLAVSSGTAALRCALAALGPPAGAEVLVPPCTFIATINAIVLSGYTPVFCEIDASLGIDPPRLGERLSSRTVGIVAVHLQGSACHIDAINEFAEQHGLWLLEDCAQSLGVYYHGRHTGTSGQFGAFSLQAHKTITSGEGGLLISNDETLFGAARRYQDQGGERRLDDYPSWDHPDAGFGENYKMSELQAAVALAQLNKLNIIRNLMRDCHARLADGLELGGRPLREDCDAQGSLPHSLIFYAHNAVDREHLLSDLQKHGIPCDGLYDEPPYRSGPLLRWSRGEVVMGCPDPGRRPQFEPCPDAEELMARIIRLPLSAAYTEDDLNLLVETANQCLAKH